MKLHHNAAASSMIAACAALALAVYPSLIGAGTGARSAAILRADSVLSLAPNRSNVAVYVVADTSFDPQTGFFTYMYTVTNDQGALNSVHAFGIAPAPFPYEATAPPEWGTFYGWDEKDDAIVWAVTDTLTPPPPGHGENLYPSPFAIQAGETKIGFSFKSAVPPGTFGNVSFYAEGFDTIPGMQVTPYPTLFQDGVSGPTLGPGSTVDIDNGKGSGRMIELHPPVPNPMTKTVSFAFHLPHSVQVGLSVYTVSGRLLRILVDGNRPAGVHSIIWDGRDKHGQRVAPGVYFYKLIIDGVSVGERKVVVLP